MQISTSRPLIWGPFPLGSPFVTRGGRRGGGRMLLALQRTYVLYVRRTCVPKPVQIQNVTARQVVYAFPPLWSNTRPNPRLYLPYSVLVHTSSNVPAIRRRYKWTCVYILFGLPIPPLLPRTSGCLIRFYIKLINLVKSTTYDLFLSHSLFSLIHTALLLLFSSCATTST